MTEAEAEREAARTSGWTSPKVIEHINREWRSCHCSPCFWRGAKIRKLMALPSPGGPAPAARVERTAIGDQFVVVDVPRRAIPTGKLRPARGQADVTALPLFASESGATQLDIIPPVAGKGA